MSATEPVLEQAPDDAAPKDDLDALADVEQYGFVKAIGSLGYVFWIVGVMEMVERLAYFGVATVRTLYATDPVEKGGLGVTLSRFGWIMAAWALVQSIVPAFTGGLSDRYGYKETIFASTAVKISGYLVMAFFPSYWGFFAGAMLLATGTAIFKPGIQGTLVKATRRENSSIAWGIFYQTVNIGGWAGPLVAGAMRKLEWRYVFLACAGIICLNFLMLITYKEPGKAERLAQAARDRANRAPRKSLFAESLHELKKTHVWLYLVIFSGFWFMFMSLYDVLPNHIQDWVDTRSLVRAITGGGEPGFVASKLIVLSKDATEILPEGMVNIDAALIMTTCFLFAFLSGKMKAVHSMVLGTLLSASGLFLAGYGAAGVVVAAAIAVFALGEMLASPKFSEFMGNFAPADKKAMYLGFSQVPIAIGWTLEGKIGPMLYDRLASKEKFAREMLLGQGWAADKVKAIPEGKAFDELVAFLHQDRWEVTRQLYEAHRAGIAEVWYVMGAVGLATAVGIHLYGRWLTARRAQDAA